MIRLEQLTQWILLSAFGVFCFNAVGCNMDSQGSKLDGRLAVYLDSIECPYALDEHGCITDISPDTDADTSMAEFAKYHEQGGLRHVRELHAKYAAELTDKGLVCAWNWQTLTHIHADGASTTGAGWKLLLEAGFVNNLEYVLASMMTRTDVAAEHFARLPRLRFLGLGHSDLTDDGLAQLAQSKSLEELDISYAPVSGKGIRLLSGVTTLRMLALEGTNVDDNAVQNICGLPLLETLSIHETSLTSGAFARIGQCTRLKSLFVCQTKIDDDAIRMLSACPQLDSLEISDNQVSDACLPDLMKLTNLTYLRIHKTALSDSGVQCLQEVLPRCNIVR